jgi:hypothetical protein
LKKNFGYDIGFHNGNKPLLPLLCSHFKQVSPTYPAWMKAYTVKKLFDIPVSSLDVTYSSGVGIMMSHINYSRLGKVW